METVHLLISGKVQGVFYRATAKDIAEKLNLTGWIKNTKDKKVEAVISGMPADVVSFMNWCKKGPERSEVKEVVARKIEFQKFSDFRVIR